MLVQVGEGLDMIPWDNGSVGCCFDICVVPFDARLLMAASHREARCLLLQLRGRARLKMTLSLFV